MINISSLKNQLSEVLRKVKKGEEVLILDRSHPVAKLCPLSLSDKSKDQKWHFTELEARGIIKKPSRPRLKVEALRKNRLKIKGSVVEALLNERKETLY